MFIMLLCSLMITVVCVIKIANGLSGEINVLHEPGSCTPDEYFNVNQLKCIVCDSEKNLMPSDDGLSCVCNGKSKIKNWNAGWFPECEPCEDGEIPTVDRRDCILCPRENVVTKGNSTSCMKFTCPENHIRMERWPNGTLNKNSECVECGVDLEASANGIECEPCFHKCVCPFYQQNVQGLCVPSELIKDWPEERATFVITFENGKKIDSQFLREHLRREVSLCKMKNQTACQMVANMCVLVMYNDEQKASPCSLFRELKRIPTSNVDALPWMYYGEGDASTVLSRKRIAAQFNLDLKSQMSYLNLTGIYYNADGTLKDMRQVTGHMLQLCPASWGFMDRTLRFASRYSHSCEITAQQLLADKKTEFVDLFLHYREGDENLLYALPILIKNIRTDGKYDNRESDRSQWQLVRRFFLVDIISGCQFDQKHLDENKRMPEAIRYAKAVTLNIKLQGKEDEGKIFVPYLVVEYGELSREQISKNVLVKLSFDVKYEMPNTLSHAIEVCMGVFSALAVVWSGIRTWSHSKRSGRVTIDLMTIAHLALFTCGNLANVFFLIVFCASLDIFVFFKGQSAIHVLLPSPAQEDLIQVYVTVAFLLKIVEVGYLIYNQVTIDIFFIDWERPRARNSVPRTTGNGSVNSDLEEQQPVSIWRTYFVANEWNEIQTKRKLNISLHLLITVFLLKEVGLEHWATSDPELHTSLPADSVGNPLSFTCRFAVGGLVYLTTYLIQWILMTVIYERYVKNGIQEFVDMCSMANISVFILALENYGYYIHGRSAHGFADTDMQNIINQLQREEEDLVGHRGLLPGTEQQTFEMTVPVQLRSYYRKVMAPLRTVAQSVKRLASNPGAGFRSKMGMENVDRSIQAYHNMNRFLAAFLEHALKDLDYEVREKLFTESLLGIEFTEASDKGVLYSDNGHSFDNVLFYGNEFVLLTFDVMLFCFVEVLAHDFLLAGIVTAVASQLMSMVRRLGGRKNLAKKTLIDERFLI